MQPDFTEMPMDRRRSRVEPPILEVFAHRDDRVLDLDRSAVRDQFRRTRPRLDAFTTSVATPQLIEEPRADPVLRTEPDHVHVPHVDLDDQPTDTHLHIPSSHDPMVTTRTQV